MRSIFSSLFDIRKIPGESLEQISEYVKKNHFVLDRLLKATPTLEMFHRLEKNAAKNGWDYACQEALNEAGIFYKVIGRENIPKDGTVVFPSNHPYGILDGFLFGAAVLPVFKKMKKKFKILATRQLKIIKGIEELVKFVNPTDGHYTSALRESVKYLYSDGSLAMCPAGRISGAYLEEYPWRRGVGFLASHSSYAVPMWISGPDHGRFYNFLANNSLTEKLRNLLLMREHWNKDGKRFVLNIGKPISSEEIREIGSIEGATQYLREKSQALALHIS